MEPENSKLMPSLLLVITFLGYSCASTDQQQAADEYNSNYNNYGDSEAVNNAAPTEGGGYDYDSEGVNNYNYNEFETDNELALNESANSDLALNNYSEEAEALSDDLLGGDAILEGTEALNVAENSGYGNDLPSDAAELANAVSETDSPVLDAPVNASSTPSGAGLVKYVLRTTTLLDGPGGARIGQLDKGDHPLVYDEGEYHRNSAGRYMESSSLTPQVVGRDKNPAYWRSSGGGGY